MSLKNTLLGRIERDEPRVERVVGNGAIFADEVREKFAAHAALDEGLRVRIRRGMQVVVDGPRRQDRAYADQGDRCLAG